MSAESGCAGNAALIDTGRGGARPNAFALVDRVIGQYAGPDADDRYAGAVALVAHQGAVLYHRAFGWAQTHDGPLPLQAPRSMTLTTAFDLASITKVAATTVAIMTLVDQERVDLDEPVVKHLPDFVGRRKGQVTVRHLLTHRAGLPEWLPIYLYGRDRASALAHAQSVGLRYEVGRCRHYSDLGFMLLGAIVEETTGQRLDRYVAEHVHGPLGMSATRFTPPSGPGAEVAATSLGNAYEVTMIETGSPHPVDRHPLCFTGWRDYTLVGEVNDGNAWYGFHGVAGHAGLFGTARDLAVLGQTLIDGGCYGDAELTSPETVAMFLHEPYDSGQAVGFLSDRLSVVGAAGGFGHSGFTGTEFMFDPQRALIAVLLTNRLHPSRGPRSIAPVWHAVLRAALAVASTGERPP